MSQQQDILVCFPLRIDWENSSLDVREETSYPEPAVTSRSARALTFPMPQPVMSLAEFAREQGWEVRVQYAQGRPPHGSTGRPMALRDSIAVIFGGHPLRPERAGYACYERTAPNGAWAWDGIVIRGADFPPYAGCGITELRAFLEMSAVTDGPALKSWISDLKAIAANGAEMQKRRDAVRKEIRIMHLAGESIERICEHAAEFYDQEQVLKLLNTKSRAAEKETAR